MQRYERYKDSGIEWLGEIPSHWGMLNIGAITQVKSDKNHSDYQVLSVYREYGVIPKESREDNHNVTSENKEIYKAVHPNDFVINKMKAWQGSMGISKYKGIVSPAYITCSVDVSIIYCDFLHYLLRCQLYIEEYNRLSYGVRIGQWDMHYDDFKHILIPITSIEEQSAIARFLDEKCEQIDRAVAQKERVIELLNERRQIVIQRAVTRGLNPDVPLRDSGIDWIGQIPAHWQVKKLKNICYINPTKRNYRPEDRDEVVQFLPMEKVTEFGVYDVNNFASYSTVCTGFTYFEKGDIILAKITPCFENGKGAYLQNISTYFGFGSTEFHVLRPNNLVVGQFLYYITRSEVFRKRGEALMTGSAGQKRVQTSFVENYTISVPSIVEQEEIANYLDKVNEKIDRAVALKREEIEKLKEYKQTLINSAVTGKIKIA